MTDPCTVVIFGASGDLAARKLFPALFHLYCDGALHDEFALVGVARGQMSDDDFRRKVYESVRDGSDPSPPGQIDEERFSRFAPRVSYIQGDIGDATIPPILLLRHRAVSTSGNAEQHLDVDGRRYSHVIDPTSRLGLVDDITVTVVARHGIHADGLDTAMGVLGIDRGLAMIERDPEAAALVVLRKGGATTARASSRMRALIAEQKAR